MNPLHPNQHSADVIDRVPFETDSLPNTHGLPATCACRAKVNLNDSDCSENGCHSFTSASVFIKYSDGAFRNTGAPINRARQTSQFARNSAMGVDPSTAARPASAERFAGLPPRAFVIEGRGSSIFLGHGKVTWHVPRSSCAVVRTRSAPFSKPVVVGIDCEVGDGICEVRATSGNGVLVATAKCVSSGRRSWIDVHEGVLSTSITIHFGNYRTLSF
jgi:hypothetical protein